MVPILHYSLNPFLSMRLVYSVHSQPWFEPFVPELLRDPCIKEYTIYIYIYICTYLKLGRYPYWIYDIFLNGGD